MYELDNKNSVDLQLSNDAFFYLKYEEEPLDEDNLDEAKEILAMFHNGFVIDDNWDYVENEIDLIQATFIPYVEQKVQFKYYLEMFNDWVFQFNLLSNDEAYGRYYNNTTGKTFKEGKWPIETSNKGHSIHLANSIYDKSAHTILPIWKGVKEY